MSRRAPLAGLVAVLPACLAPGGEHDDSGRITAAASLIAEFGRAPRHPLAPLRAAVAARRSAPGRGRTAMTVQAYLAMEAGTSVDALGVRPRAVATVTGRP